jgi:hypothetical protein
VKDNVVSAVSNELRTKCRSYVVPTVSNEKAQVKDEVVSAVSKE